MATELAKAYVQIVPSAQGISGSIASVLGPEGTAAGESAGSKAASAFGSKFKGMLVGLGLGKLLMDSLGNASEFETGLAKVSTLFTGTGEELADLQGQILDMSSEYGMSATELTEAAYSAESAGVAAEDMGAMMSTSAQLATAGFTDMDTALSATAKTMNAYGMTGEEAIGNVAKVLMQTQNLGITTVGELGASLANVTPTAAAMGVSFEQVGAAMAQMTASGVPTAQATTQLRSAMTELGKAGTKADKAFRAAAKGTKYAGMSFQEAMDAGANLGDVFGMMQAYADKSGKSMVDLWGSVEAGNAAMMIASDVDTFNSNLEQMATDADVVGDAYGKMSNTLGHDMNRLKESAKNFMTALFTGGDISGSFDSMLGSLGDVGKKLIGWMTTGLKSLGEKLPELMKSLLDFGESLLTALGEVNWIELGTTIINGIIGALGTLGEKIIGLFSSAVTSLTDGTAEVDFKGIGTAILNGVKSVLTTSGEWLKKLFNAGKTAVEKINFGEIGTKIYTAITGVLDTAGDFLKTLFDSGKDAIETAAEEDWPSVGEAIKTAVNLALNGGKFLSAAFEAGAELIKNINWANVGAKAEALIVSGLDGAATLVSTISGAADTLLSNIAWDEIGKGAGELIVTGLKGAADILGSVTTAASQLVDGIEWEAIGKSAGELLTTGLSGAANILQAGFEGAVNFLNGVNWEELGTKISGALGDVFGGLGDFLGGALSGAGDVLEGAGELGGKALKGLGDWIFGGDDPKQLAADLKQAMTDMDTALKNGKTTLETTAKSIGTGIKTSISDNCKLNPVGQTMMANLSGGMTAKVVDLSKTVSTISTGIKNALKGPAGTWEAIGKYIINGVVAGIKAAQETLFSTLRDIAAQALQAAKDSLEIGSPSRLMRDQVGKWIPAGIAEGIEEYAGLVDGAMDDIAYGMNGGRLQVALADGPSTSGMTGNGGYEYLAAGISSMDSAMETQNTLLREQNSLLTRILERTGISTGVSARLGRTVSQSVEMYNTIGG